MPCKIHFISIQNLLPVAFIWLWMINEDFVHSKRLVLVQDMVPAAQ